VATATGRANMYNLMWLSFLDVSALPKS
jgi:hypothetical protein